MTKTQLGIFLTLIWFLVLTIFLYLSDLSFSSVSLNEWGDFLAGVVAPIAFFWFVLGYLQQSDELKENTQALKHQKDEYEKSVKLSAYTALIHYELKEVELFNSLGEEYKKAAQNARDRASEYKKEIEDLLGSRSDN